MVKNVGEGGGPRKMRSYWKDQVYVIVGRKIADSPVYEVRPENGSGRARILHRNLILPCDSLPVAEPQRPHREGTAQSERLLRRMQTCC